MVGSYLTFGSPPHCAHTLIALLLLASLQPLTAQDRLLRSAVTPPAAWLGSTAVATARSVCQPPMLPPAVGGKTRADNVGAYAGKDLFLPVHGGVGLLHENGSVRVLTVAPRETLTQIP